MLSKAVFEYWNLKEAEMKEAGKKISLYCLEQRKKENLVKKMMPEDL